MAALLVELVEHLFAIYPEMRVLLMSGYSNDAVSGFEETFANVYLLEKPFSYKELVNKVRQVLDGEPISHR